MKQLLWCAHLTHTHTHTHTLRHTHTHTQTDTFHVLTFGVTLNKVHSPRTLVHQCLPKQHVEFCKVFSSLHTENITQQTLYSEIQQIS